jgi:hypothetical protein
LRNSLGSTQIVPPHRQIQIEVKGRSFEVDEGIADLVRELGEQGYQTVGSCEDQDGCGRAWVGLSSTYQAQRFAELIDGDLMIPTDANRAEAAAEGDETYEGMDAVGVSFPTPFIPDVLAKVVARRK